MVHDEEYIESENCVVSEVDSGTKCLYHALSYLGGF